MLPISLIPIEIETERLIIQPFQDDDFENSVLLYSDARITKYFDFGVPRSRDEIKNMVDHYCSFFKETKYLGLFSIFRKDTMCFIGHFDCITTNENGVLEIGFIIHQQYHGYGFALEVLKNFLYRYILMVKHDIGKCDIHGIMATVHPQNISSIKLLEKIGMKLDGAIIRFDQPRLRYFLSI